MRSALETTNVDATKVFFSSTPSRLCFVTDNGFNGISCRSPWGKETKRRGKKLSTNQTFKVKRIALSLRQRNLICVTRRDKTKDYVNSSREGCRERELLSLWHVRMCVKCRCDENKSKRFTSRKKLFFAFYWSRESREPIKRQVTQILSQCVVRQIVELLNWNGTERGECFLDMNAAIICFNESGKLLEGIEKIIIRLNVQHDSADTNTKGKAEGAYVGGGWRAELNMMKHRREGKEVESFKDFQAEVTIYVQLTDPTHDILLACKWDFSGKVT